MLASPLFYNCHVHSALLVSDPASAFSPAGWQVGCFIHMCHSDILWIGKLPDCMALPWCHYVLQNHICSIFFAKLSLMTCSVLVLDDNYHALCYKWIGWNNCFRFAQGLKKPFHSAPFVTEHPTHLFAYLDVFHDSFSKPCSKTLLMSFTNHNGCHE